MRSEESSSPFCRHLPRRGHEVSHPCPLRRNPCGQRQEPDSRSMSGSPLSLGLRQHTGRCDPRWSDQEGAENRPPRCGLTVVALATPARARLATSGPRPPQTCRSGICTRTGSRGGRRRHDAQDGRRLPQPAQLRRGNVRKERDAPIRSAFPRRVVARWRKTTRTRVLHG